MQAYLASGKVDADTAKGIAEHQVKFAKDVRKMFYVNCWHLGDIESEAMWRIYCGPAGGVAIVLPYEKLRASIDSARNQAWVGVVRYLNYDTDLLRPGNAFIPALHKRKQFEYEQEARIVKLWADPAATAPGQEPSSIAIPWDIGVIERIIVSPYASGWYAETVRSVVDRLVPGLGVKVSQSLMANEPV